MSNISVCYATGEIIFLKAPGESNHEVGGYTLALVGSGLVKRDEERVKTHGEETV